MTDLLTPPRIGRHQIFAEPTDNTPVTAPLPFAPAAVFDSISAFEPAELAQSGAAAETTATFAATAVFEPTIAAPFDVTPPTSALQTRNLTKRYGDFYALNDVSINVNQGDIYGLVGRNGAGKTTLFKCVMGLTQPTSGEIRLGKSTSQNLNDRRREMGFMINPSFFPYLNPAQNLEYLCRVKGIPADQRTAEVNRLLDTVGLVGVKKPFKAFSLGMKQRLGIAGALLGNPQMVVLDEPINGLDPQGIIDVRRVIQNVHEEHGTTFIVSSHILAELDLVATKFGFINHGRLLQEISHGDLHQQTQRTLQIVTDDPADAARVLVSAGVAPATMEVHVDDTAAAPQYTLVLNSDLDRSAEFASLLVRSGIQVFDLHRQETTLENYFMNLVGDSESNPTRS